MTMRVVLALLCALFWASGAGAQGLSRVTNCGDGQPPAGTTPGTQDATGRACGSVTITPSAVTLVPLDIATVTTGGTAVTALNAGNAAKGGYIITANAAGICVDQQATAGTATGTPSTTTCVGANDPFNLQPSAHAVSVNSTASSVTLAGQGAK